MGYYTRHELEIKEIRNNLTYDEVFNTTIEKLTELDVIDYAFYDNLESCDEPVKWYSHKGDMKVLSLYIKDVLFLLSGEGEESGDIWKEYWINGKHQRCNAIMTFEEFDESKLEL